MQSHLMTKRGEALCKKVPSWAYMVTLRSLVTCKWCLKILDKDNEQVPTPDIVDPIEQLAMSIAWSEEYTDEYKRSTVYNAIRYYITGERPTPEVKR